jgi:hypothetical protein
MNVGDDVPNSFFGYLLNGEEENSLAFTCGRDKGFGIKVFQKRYGRQRTYWGIMDKC